MRITKSGISRSVPDLDSVPPAVFPKDSSAEILVYDCETEARSCRATATGLLAYPQLKECVGSCIWKVVAQRPSPIRAVTDPIGEIRRDHSDWPVRCGRLCRQFLILT